MANTPGILDYIVDVSPAATLPPVAGQSADVMSVSGESIVRFANKGSARLGAASDRERRLLDKLKSIDAPVYVELSDDDSLVVAASIPVIGTVTDATVLSSNDVAVTVDSSASVFTIRADAEDRDGLLDRVQKSKATASPIAIVRGIRGQDVRLIQDPPAPIGESQEIDPPAIHDGAAPAPSLEVLNAFVANLSATEACHLPPHGVCIPFMYVMDGCWARAHKTCELLLQAHILARKVWVYSQPGRQLGAQTPFHPSCFVHWNFHVAPLVEVVGIGDHVIDLSLFADRAVPLQEWIDAMGVPQPLMQMTDASIYRNAPPGQGRRENRTLEHQVLSENDRDLLLYAEELLQLSLDDEGPAGPPYAACQLDD